MTYPLPIIDIDDLWSTDTEAKRRVAGDLGRACRDTGFFAIRGHGVPEDLVREAFCASREFFALADEVKQTLDVGARGPHRGYVGPDADRKEAFSLVRGDGATHPSNVWPAIAGWRATVQSYFDALLRVGEAMHRAFALDLDLAGQRRDPQADRPLETLRMFRYPAQWGAASTTRPATPDAGVHTDPGGLTVLAAGDVGRLQVRMPPGHWVDIPPLQGAFVCNVGDELARWTKGVYVSTPHRVLPPQHERYSIVFFA